ncbi:hypothetical protein BDV93DRAFT_511364 [Ceratobasidium sp. AG-I]|nr:hypothetical protein BDV93DRAFT_511364 [Ceratobasidium sp. AG-I]
MPPEIPPLRKKKRFLPDESLRNAPTKASQAPTIKAVRERVDTPTSDVPGRSNIVREPSILVDDLGDGTVEEEEAAEEQQSIEEDEEDGGDREGGESVGEESKRKVLNKNEAVSREDFDIPHGLVEDLVRTRVASKGGLAIPTPPSSLLHKRRECRNGVFRYGGRDRTRRLSWFSADRTVH